jgi:glucokinase
VFTESDIMMPSGWAIGIDVGGTKVAAGLVEFPEARIHARRQIPTGAGRSGRAVLDDVMVVAHDLKNEASRVGHSVSAIGLGICELVDPGGKIMSSNCIDWLNHPVHQELSSIAPATVDADVRAAALAETLFGAGRPMRTFLYVTIGTGISSCLILDRKPYLGARGATGTMASSSMSITCEHCGQLNTRTLEHIAAGPALAAIFNARGGTADSAPDVLSAAHSGNDVARDVIRTAAETLGAQIGLLVNVLDPEAVVIGGGLGLSHGLFADHLFASTRRHIWSGIHRELPIVHAELGVDAGWIGAAASAALRTGRLSA